MFTIQEESAVLMAELHQRIRGFEDKISLIVKEQEEKDQDYEDIYQKLIIKDEQVFQLES